MKIWVCDDNELMSDYMADLIRYNFPQWEVLSLQEIPDLITCDVLVSDYFFESYTLKDKIKMNRSYELIIFSGHPCNIEATHFYKPNDTRVIEYLRSKYLTMPACSTLKIEDRI